MTILRKEIKQGLKNHPMNLHYCIAMDITPQTLVRWLNTNSDRLTTKKSTDFICSYFSKKLIDIYEKN
jgi:hypothetical protein